MTNNDIPVKAIRRATRILYELKDLDGAGISEIAQRLDMPSSTVYDHLYTLYEEGFVVKNGSEYELAVKFLDLGGYARSQKQIYRVAVPEIQRIAEETGEHSNLMTEEHGMGIFLYRARGPDALMLDTYTGMQVHLHTTAMGKAILAYLPENRIEEIIDRHGLPKWTDRTITSRDDLFDELAEIRNREYAIDNEERLAGVRCVAKPVCDSEGHSIGAISISGPTSRMKGTVFEEEYPQRLEQAVNIVEVNSTHG